MSVKRFKFYKTDRLVENTIGRILESLPLSVRQVKDPDNPLKKHHQTYFTHDCEINIKTIGKKVLDDRDVDLIQKKEAAHETK